MDRLWLSKTRGSGLHTQPGKLFNLQKAQHNENYPDKAKFLQRHLFRYFEQPLFFPTRCRDLPDHPEKLRVPDFPGCGPYGLYPAFFDFNQHEIHDQAGFNPTPADSINYFLFYGQL
jgi:hypothetical protein